MSAYEGLSHLPLDLDDLPNGWTVSSLVGAGSEVESGFASGKHNSTGEGVTHLRPMNIDRGGQIDLGVVKSVASDNSPKRIRLGEVLFNNTNSPALVGKTAYVGLDGDWAFSNHMTRVAPGAALDARFLAHQLHYFWSVGYFAHICTNHVNQASVSSKRLAGAVPLVVPPLLEQRRIIAAVDEHFSRAEAAVRAAKDAAQRADQLESLIEQELVSGSFETSGLEDLAEVTVDCLHSTPKFVREGRVCLDTNAMSPGRIDRTLLRFVDDKTFLERNRRLVPQAGDVIFAREGSAAIGFAVVIPDDLEVCLGQRVMLIRPSDLISSGYLEAVLNSRFVRAQYADKIRGSAAPHLNMSDIRGLRIPVPPRYEQDRIVEAVGDCRASFDRLASGFRRVEQRAAALRRSILAAAFGGRLVPQDPSDEPASMLLERIAAQRAVAKPSRRMEAAS